MKLSLESYVLREKFGDLEGLRLIRDAGFDCVDMSYYWTAEGSELLGEGYCEYARGLRKHLDAIGLECNQAHAPFDLRYGEEFDCANPRYRAIVRSIESASILGAKAIIVHSIWHPADGRIVFDREYNLKFYQSLLPFCEKFGICVAVENLFAHDKKRKYHAGLLGTPAELLAFIRDLNSPYFVGCVDVGHAALTGNEPEDFLRGMDETLLKAVHVQDGDFLADRHVLPFLGDFRWAEIMKALKEKHYEGELTFEIFKYLSGFPKEMLPEALRLAERCGRYLISLFDRA